MFIVLKKRQIIVAAVILLCVILLCILLPALLSNNSGTGTTNPNDGVLSPAGVQFGGKETQMDAGNGIPLPVSRIG